MNMNKLKDIFNNRSINFTHLKCDSFKHLNSTFPNDYFSLDERQQGYIMAHIVLAFYMIIFAEHINNRYLMPSLEYFSFETVNLSVPAAGSTILAFGSSLFEIFYATFGIAFGKHDLSLFTTLGSSAYNLFIILSLCCFSVYTHEIKLNQFSVVKDLIFYMFNLLLLLVILLKNNKSYFYWVDSLLSIGVYVLLIVFNIFEHRVYAFLSRLVKKYQREQGSSIEMTELRNVQQIDAADEEDPAMAAAANFDIRSNGKQTRRLKLINKYRLIELISVNRLEFHRSFQPFRYINQSYEEPYNFFQSYQELQPSNLFTKIKLFVLLPVRIVSFLTIVDFRRFDRKNNLAVMITLISSVLLLGLCSFVFMWMVTIVCETFQFSKALVGFVFLSCAISMKETIAIIDLTKSELKKFNNYTQKTAQMRLSYVLSSIIGCNMFDLTIGIGLPYLINSVLITHEYYTLITEKNIVLVVIGLLLCAIGLILTLVLFKFRLTKYHGMVLLTSWSIFVYFISKVEIRNFHFGGYLPFLYKKAC